MEDNGTLAFLNIEPEKGSRHFNCKEITQQKLINREFWIIDYISDVKTKFGSDRFLVKIKFNKEDTECYKFFTNAKEVKYVVTKIGEMKAFPRKATMYASGTRYYLG